MTAALFCENVIKDERGAHSAIRIIDQLTVTLDPSVPHDYPSKDKPLAIQLNLLLCFRTGGAPGDHMLRLRMRTESGDIKKVVLPDQKAKFTPHSYGGATIHTHVPIILTKPDVLWLDVYLDNRLKTSVPFAIHIVRNKEPLLPTKPQMISDARAPKSAK